MRSIKKNPVLLAEQMAAVDRYTIEKIGIPGAVLMEQAGKAVADVCLQQLRPGSSAKVVVLCGCGNNGGDGFVVARRLLGIVPEVKVILLGSVDKLKGDAELNALCWQKLGQKIDLFEASTESDFLTADLIVDALLGTGSKGALRAAYARAAKLINMSNAIVIAVDLPTGVDADTGEVDENAVKAQSTVTFGALKAGLIFSPGREYTGRLHCADIGFPQKAFSAVKNETFLLPNDEIHTLLPSRHPAVFKNKCGQIFVIAGSEGMAGAAALTSTAALRAGGGLVVLGTKPDIIAQLAAHPLEVVKHPLHWQNNSMPAKNLEKFRERLQWADVVAIGPGLGLEDDAEFWLEQVLSYFHGPLIIDADGINLLRNCKDRLKKRRGGTVLTPHPGEFLRLTGRKKDDLPRVPVSVARQFAEEYNAILLLKGAPSLVALPDGKVYINCAGNPGMATAGMGDVLTGIIAGLSGQITLENATILGMFLHSRAADIAAADIDLLSLTAGDVLSYIPQTFKEIRNRYG
ncbi:MAG: NAD(P)H-hydrate dehydratase [Calditrichaeota bacterium]|nr:MAG: NAD(P)H-hydrate dehydratase [Calditrichota bacterium]